MSETLRRLQARAAGTHQKRWAAPLTLENTPPGAPARLPSSSVLSSAKKAAKLVCRTAASKCSMPCMSRMEKSMEASARRWARKAPSLKMRRALDTLRADLVHL